MTLLRAFGGELLSEDGTTFQLTSDEGMAAVKYAYDLHPHAQRRTETRRDCGQR